MLLVVVQSVMGGFGNEIRTRIIDIEGHIQIRSPGILRDTDKLVETARKHPSIAQAAPFAQGMVMLQYNLRPTFPGIRGFDPNDLRTVLPMDRFLVSGSLDDLDDDSVLISSGLALDLGARTGDELELYTPLMLERLKEDSILMPRSVRIAGIFETGWQAVDGATVISTLRLMQDIYNLGDGAHGITLRMKPGIHAARAPEVAAQLQQMLPPTVRALSWLEVNGEFLWALAFEKNMIFFLMLCVVLIAAFAIASNMLVTVVRKTREIGVLGAMGGTPRSIAACFCWQGLAIGLAGTILGILLALVLLHFRNELVALLAYLSGQDTVLLHVYQFHQLPVHYSAADFIRISSASVLLSTLAGLLPAWRAAQLKPADALRSE
jgi:lipoprotein-releasing system permease protein